MADMKQRLEEAIEALNTGGEDALLQLEQLYHPDVRFQDPFHIFDSRQALLDYNRRLLRRARSLRMDLHEVREIGDLLMATWSMKYEPRRGPTLTFEGVSVFHHDGERVTSHRDYFDPVGDAVSRVPGLGRAYRAVTARLT